MSRLTVEAILLSILIGASGSVWPAIGASPLETGSSAPTIDQPAGTIAFSSLAPRGWDLYLVEVASRQTRCLTDQPQPYGDLFVVRLDGTGLLRLTHNSFEEGTPAWGPLVPNALEPSAAARPAAEEY
jgi:hypothetical protein